MSFLEVDKTSTNHSAEVVLARRVTVCEHAEASQAQDYFETSMNSRRTQHAARLHTGSHILHLLVTRSGFSTEVDHEVGQPGADHTSLSLHSALTSSKSFDQSAFQALHWSSG